MTIADLKVGSKLVFGAYGVGGAIYPITWLKANKEGEFLSEFVLDMVKFDEEERGNPEHDCRYCGNGNYELSNVLQFLNSCDDDWYGPMHEYDAPPGNLTRPGERLGEYLRHSGFLHEFQDHEIESIAGRVNLPTIANIFGANGEPKFALFNRKGYRGKPTTDLVYGRHGHGLEEWSYCEYWMVGGTNTTYSQSYVGRDGSKHNTYADHVSGLRPKCVIRPELEVELIDDGVYRIVPFQATKRHGPQIATDEELLNLMGLL